MKHRSEMLWRQTAWIALVILVASYVFFVWTPYGQALENAALRGADQALGEDLAEAKEMLGRITIWSLIAVTALLGVTSWVRKNFMFSVVNTGIIGASLIATQLLKRFILPRPYLIEANEKFINNSFPSGHTTIAIAVFFALLIVSAWRYRWLVLFLLTPYVISIAAWTMTAKWHRLSDTLGANAIVLGIACAASLWLSQSGYLQGAPRQRSRFRYTVKVVTALVALGSFALGTLLVALTGSPFANDDIIDYNLYLGLSAFASAGSITTVLVFWWSWESFELVPRKPTHTPRPM